MATLTATLDRPFPIVRSVELSAHRREQILSLLSTVDIGMYLAEDTLPCYELDRMLSLISIHEGSPSYYFNSGEYWIISNLSGFLDNDSLKELRKVENWEKFITLGHPTEFGDLGDDPHLRISTSLFEDALGRKCKAEVVFIPVVKEDKKRFLKLHSDAIASEDEFVYSKYADLWDRLELQIEDGVEFEVYKNSISGADFIRIIWTGEPNHEPFEFDDETYSAIVTPQYMFPERSFSIYTKE